MSDTNRETGKVIFFNKEKGFGFIKPDSPAQKDNLFLHIKEIKTVGVTDLAEHTAVEFNTERRDKGPAAVEVTVA